MIPIPGGRVTPEVRGHEGHAGHERRQRDVTGHDENGSERDDSERRMKSGRGRERRPSWWRRPCLPGIQGRSGTCGQGSRRVREHRKVDRARPGEAGQKPGETKRRQKPFEQIEKEDQK